MKKARIFTLFALIVIISVFMLVGCGDSVDPVTSLSLKNNDPNTAIEVALGEFDCSAYTLIVAHESGSTEEIPLKEEMITEADFFKLYQIGDHDITVNYGEKNYTFKLSVKRATFGDLSFPESNVFTYDGKAHTVEVDGNVPANATVNYIGGNSFVNAGTYDVTAVVSCEGYVTQRLTTTVKIERAKYDMSGVKFEGKTVVYDGNVHSVEISGTLPDGAPSPIYTINGKNTSSATDVGEYTVKANFVGIDPNYEPIPEMQATLKITPAEYAVKGVDIVFKNDGGSVISNATKIYDGKSVSFDLNDYGKLSKKISVSFSVSDKDGKVISTSNKNTGIINAGVYTVKAEFTMADGKNYQPIDPIVRTIEVLKADYPALENIKFTSAQTTYDGKEHSIEIEGQLLKDVSVSYEYYKDDKLVLASDGKPAQSVVDAGRYTVKAVFSHKDVNRKEIAPISATLLVEQATIDSFEIEFEYDDTWVYDGTAKSLKVIVPDYLDASIEYYLNGALVKNADGTAAKEVKEIGEYTAKVSITSKDNNYAPMEPVSLTFSIVAES